MNRMNQILSFDPNSSIVKTQAGVVLQSLKDYLEEFGHMPPIDLGSRATCQIGGNLATNAGGINLLKHNSLHANTIGLTTVLADSSVLEDMKDNTGYDLKHLFIGSEGTLGIITEAAILCPKIPTCQNVALFAVEDFSQVQNVLSATKHHFPENLTAIEYFDKE